MMETLKKINKEIMEISQKIKEQSPELTKYLEELTVSIPDQDEVDVNELKAYRDTLKNMLNKYTEENQKK